MQQPSFYRRELKEGIPKSQRSRVETRHLKQLDNLQEAQEGCDVTSVFHVEPKYER